MARQADGRAIGSASTARSRAGRRPSSRRADERVDRVAVGADGGGHDLAVLVLEDLGLVEGGAPALDRERERLLGVGDAEGDVADAVAVQRWWRRPRGRGRGPWSARSGSRAARARRRRGRARRSPGRRSRPAEAERGAVVVGRLLGVADPELDRVVALEGQVGAVGGRSRGRRVIHGESPRSVGTGAGSRSPVGARRRAPGRSARCTNAGADHHTTDGGRAGRTLGQPPGPHGRCATPRGRVRRRDQTGGIIPGGRSVRPRAATARTRATDAQELDRFVVGEVLLADGGTSSTVTPPYQTSSGAT
jgi:hypothetical protein